MKLKIGELARRSGVRPSTIRYYVGEGLLPRPEKTNEKMAYYDEACIDKLRAIQELKERRYFPLYLIKNILRRMDEGLSLPEAEMVENAVFGSKDSIGRGLVNRQAFLEATGLTEKELQKAERLGLLIPYTTATAEPLYNDDDVRMGRDGIKQLCRLGTDLREFSFLVELGTQIVEREMALRHKIVAGKSMRENILITSELTRIGHFYRDYILRRLFQKQVEQNIQKSLKKKSKKPAANHRRQK
ncbi:MAG: MerR family transcriptional regulator [Deltaproteobacteria bacterium]|nr:MerR family transcriptional regulator [Deltaproteobacteria bacterium]